MSTLRMVSRALALLQHWLVFLFLISLLPIFVQFVTPLQPYLLGLYRDLSSWDLFVVSLVGGIAVWSLMITQALLIDSVVARTQIASQEGKRTGIKAFGQDPATAYQLLPTWLVKTLNWPLTWSQVGIYFLFVTPGLFTIIYYSEAGWFFGSLAAAAGIAVAFVCMFLLTLPAFWAGETTIAVTNLPPFDQRWKAAQVQESWRRTSFSFLRKGVSRLLQWARMNYLLEEVTDKYGQRQTLMVASHFWALVTVLVLSILYFGFNRSIRPPSLWEFPAVAHVLILITLLVWLVQWIEFHLSLIYIPWRIPTYLALISLVVVLQMVRATDYNFTVIHHQPPATEKPLTPVEVALSSQRKDNLVIITSTGGGILAAGWTTQALEKLIGKRPELAKEIRLISAASGGSVGAAFYVDALRRQFADTTDCQPSPALLQTVRENSTKSSLSAAAYGFSFIDFWTILFGGPVLAKTDRGRLLDEKWAFNASGSLEPPQPLLSDLADGIRRGCLPAPIFNTTVMENGRRIMITPIDFLRSPDKRAMTLAEYLSSQDLESSSMQASSQVDINLWTAARLSATFPYVSPAVRAYFPDEKADQKPAVFLGHHFIDGGYHDNYGVASALDWLDPVLNEQAKGDSASDLSFQRVLIIQLRVSPTGDSRYARASKGYMASFLGPLVGLLQIRNGAAYMRNEVELDRFIRNWRARLPDPFHIDTVILEPATNKALLLSPDPNAEPPSSEVLPLSWHLTQTEIKQLEELWHSALNDCVDEIAKYLNEEIEEISKKCREGKYQ